MMGSVLPNPRSGFWSWRFFWFYCFFSRFGRIGKSFETSGTLSGGCAIMEPMIVFENSYFRVEQSASTVAGHLILRLVKPANHLQEMPAEALAELGPLLARAMAAIEKVVKPERVYVIRLGEEVEAIHFHLFPRTKVMLDLYRKAYPRLPVSGAQIFDWARQPHIIAHLETSISPEKALPLLKKAFAAIF
jgi:diadenosine tetraphosphate (Ap4A) HIT family hydrolase